MVTNGTFDSNTTGWTAVRSTIASVSGGQSGNCLEITRTGDPDQSATLASTMTAVVGKKYRLTAYVKSGTSGNEEFHLQLVTGSDYGRTTGTSSGSWVAHTLEYTATTTAMNITLRKNSSTAGTMLFDTVSVVPIGAVAEYDGSGAGEKIWGDKSGNDLHGTVSGATLENTPYDSGTEYEEGTWTPIITDGTNNATAGSSNSASYVRNGNQVTVFGFVQTNGLGSVSGNIKISGLPYTIKNTIGSNSSGAISYAEGLNITANKVIGLYTQVNTTNAHLSIWEATTGVNGLTGAEWSADGGATIMLTYMTA